MFFICFLAPHNLQIPQKCLFCLGVFFRLKSAHPSVKYIKLHTEHTTQPDRDGEVQANSTSLHQVWDLPSRCSVPTDRPEPPLPDD